MQEENERRNRNRYDSKIIEDKAKNDLVCIIYVLIVCLKFNINLLSKEIYYSKLDSKVKSMRESEREGL